MRKLILIAAILSLIGCKKEYIYIDSTVKKYMYFVSESKDQIERVDIFYTNGQHTEIDSDIAKEVQKVELITDSLAVHVYSHTKHDRYSTEYIRHKFRERDTLVHGVIGIFQIRH